MFDGSTDQSQAGDCDEANVNISIHAEKKICHVVSPASTLKEATLMGEAATEKMTLTYMLSSRTIEAAHDVSLTFVSHLELKSIL